MNNDVIIDGSYFIYYNLFSAINEYVKRENDPLGDSSYKLSEVEPFLDILYKKIYSRLKYFTSKFGEYDIDETNYRIWFPLDCKLKNNWRIDLYPEYKAKRDIKKTEMKFNISDAFKSAVDIISAPIIKDVFNIHILQSKRAEGDDIIYVLSKKLEGKILLLASDYDFVQLGDNVHQINLTYDDVSCEKFCGEKLSPKKYILVKALMGDNADEIPGIYSGCGKKTALKLSNNRKLLEAKFEKYENAKNILTRNIKLMGFEHIPKLILEEIEKDCFTEDDKGNLKLVEEDELMAL